MLTSAEQPVHKNRAENIFLAVIIFLCAQPLIADQAPKFLTVMPVVAALVLFFTARFAHGTWPKLSRAAMGWMLGLTVMMAASSLWSINPEGTLERAIKTGALVMSGAILFSLTPYMDAQKFKKYFPWAMVAAAALLCIDLYFGRPVFRLFHPGHYTNVIENNYAGLNRPTVFFALCLFPALACLRGNMKSWQAVLLGVLAALALYKTDSQSAQLAVLGGLVLYFLFPNKHKAMWVALGAVLAAGLFSMPWIAHWAFQNFSSVGTGKTGSLIYNTYAAIRLEIWDFIASHIMQRPWLGHGADATENIMNDTARLYFTQDHILHPHNFALQLWLEFGVLGPVFAFAFFAMLMKKIYAMPPETHRPFIAILFATIAAALTSYDLWQGWWLGAFCLLSVYGSLSVSKPQ